jgi:hypothetical protein
LSEFKTAGDMLKFRGEEIAKIIAGELMVPLSSFGSEVEIYSLLSKPVQAGDLPAPSIKGNKDAVPAGLFLHITESGLELKYGAEIPEEDNGDGSLDLIVSIAPPQPAQGGFSLQLSTMANRLFRKIAEHYPGFADAFSIEGKHIFLKLGGNGKKKIASEDNGEFRIFFEDLGWCKEITEKVPYKVKGQTREKRVAKKVASTLPITQLCGREIPNVKVLMLTNAPHTYIHITETGVFFGASSSRLSRVPLIEEKLHL